MKVADKVLLLNSKFPIILKILSWKNFSKHILFSLCENRSPFVVFGWEYGQFQVTCHVTVNPVPFYLQLVSLSLETLFSNY